MDKLQFSLLIFQLMGFGKPGLNGQLAQSHVAEVRHGDQGLVMVLSLVAKTAVLPGLKKDIVEQIHARVCVNIVHL